ncbi:MAG: GNAT family N-acetyltransferase [Verrucomicrobiota bacterium]|nr:GNAT family N-acetyltransferase [Verrucomicrobiota bacterium]
MTESAVVRNVTVVPATPATMEVAVNLFRVQLGEHEIFPAEQALREVTRTVLSNSSHGFILLAWAEPEFIGIAYAAAHLSAEHGGTVGWLEELYVAPERRGQGVGSTLLAAVISRAQQLGWRAVELEVVAGHERAVPLYLRHEFLPVSRARFTRACTAQGLVTPDYSA